MGRTEGIHNKNIAEAGVGFCQCLVILFFTGIKTYIFEQGDTATGDIDAIAPVTNHRHVTTEQFAQMSCNRLQRKGAIGLALNRATEVGHQHHPGTRCHRQANGRQGGANTGIRTHHTVFNGYV